MKSEEIKQSFEIWLKHNDISPEVVGGNVYAVNGLASIGIPIKDLFIEDNSVTIRLYSSELILKRNHCSLNGISEFEQAIRFLVFYADYLEKKNENKQKASRQRDKTKDSLIIAYYLSRRNEEAIHKLGYKTFIEAFKSIGLLLGQKHTTIKNMRDEFDPYFDNGRAGWYQRQLSASRKEVFDMLQNVSDSELDEIVRDIIADYTNDEKPKRKDNGHKRIKISSDSMKEFKAKKK